MRRKIKIKVKKNEKKRKKSPEGRMRGQENKKREREGWRGGMIEEESEVFLVRNKKEKRKDV